MNRWIKTSSELPASTTDDKAENLPCHIVVNGHVVEALWNYHEGVWDDPDGDDWLYDATTPSHWMVRLVPAAPCISCDDTGCGRCQPITHCQTCNRPRGFAHQCGQELARASEQMFVPALRIPEHVLVAALLAIDEGDDNCIGWFEAWRESAHTWASEPHGGDCTRQSISCMRCVYEDAQKRLKGFRDVLHALGLKT